MASWPSNLYGYILKDSFKEVPPNNIIRTAMDVGPPKIRRRSTAGTRKFSFSMFLPSNLVTVFDDFYDSTLHSGADSFTFRSPRTQTVGTYIFSQQPVYTSYGRRGYQISCEVELLP